MREQEIFEITAKVLSDEASVEEKKKLNVWLSESEKNKEKFEILKEAWEAPGARYQPKEIINHEHIKDIVWEKSIGNSKKASGKKMDVTFFIKVAASIAIVMTSVWGTWHYLISDPEIHAEKWVVKENPAGQKSKIYLPDGSTVWLNSASTLSFHPDFSDSLRHLVLKGEAFFEVAKDADRPFVVETGDLSVTALGTEFNVKAYDEHKMNVSLLEGKVKVSVKSIDERKTLFPGECIDYSHAEQVMVKSQFDPIKIIAWKEGILYFENAQLPEIIKELELWYGVKIQNHLSAQNMKHFNGKFDNESLDNVLNNISFAFEFDYEINGNKVIIH